MQFKMQQKFVSTPEEREAVRRFFDDCAYAEESTDGAEEGVPSIIMYLAWLEWSKRITPTVHLSFMEFNEVFSEYCPEFRSYRDSTGIAAWLGIDLTTMTHIYLRASSLFAAFEDLEKRDDGNTE